MRNVLIIEDNRDIAELQAVALRDRASVQIISDRFERVFMPATWLGVDVAVIDLMLPSVDGEDIVRFVADNHHDIRRVVCTAKPVTQLAELKPYADVILQKPFDMDTFVQAVAEHDVHRRS